MDGGKCIRTGMYYPRWCKKETLTNIDSLPDEVLFEILVRLPPQDIYDSARLVCKKWYRMITTPTFIYAHLHRTPSGLLLLTRAEVDASLLLSVRNGQIERSKFRHELSEWVWASCNSLMIDCHPSRPHKLRIVNPVTKQHFFLPRVDFLSIRFSGVAYASASMEYKVAVTRSFLNKFTGDCCFIFTVGVDNSWRNVRSAHFSFETKTAFFSLPLTTPGFLHWYGPGNQVLTLDIETETIKETPAPIPRVDGYRWIYLSTGRYLTLLLGIRDDLWEVWEMKPETGEWRKLSIISLEAHKRTFERFPLRLNEIMIPFGWLMYPEVLVFGFSRGNHPIFTYNLVTQEVVAIELPRALSCYQFLIHKNSLVRV